MAKSGSAGKKDWRVTLIEWLYSIAVAVFLAMFARYYLVETFEIPTGSMQPTLWGNPSGTDPFTVNPALRALYPGRGSSGDKVFVNKLIYDLRAPKRGDVVVFKYPESIDPQTGVATEELTTNYIKRLWGLPGETIQIVGGDVWINGRPARKPPKVQEALWQRYFDEALQRGIIEKQLEAGSRLARRSPLVSEAQAATPSALDEAVHRWIFQFWRETHSRYGDLPMVDGRLMLKAAAGAEPLELVHEPVLDYLRYRVGDLCLEFDFQAPATGGTLAMELQRDGYRFRAEVPLDGAPARLALNDQPVDLKTEPVALDRGPKAANHVRFSNADGQVSLVLNGKSVFEHDYDLKPTDRRPNEGTSRAAFGAAAADIALWNLRLRRDVYYTNPNHLPYSAGSQAKYGVAEPFKIPEGQYFFLGDNSGLSRDSRMWGTVPANYFLGEAFFIFRPVLRWRFIN